jgi:hypothetical protein
MTTALRARAEQPTAGETRMPSTATTLRQMADFINRVGIHTGPQFATKKPRWQLDICAVAFVMANNTVCPDVFYADEAVSERLIQRSALAMAAIKAISDALDSEVCTTDGEPDYIEHVCCWVANPAIGCSVPPSVSEVIGRILRAAQHAASTAA